VTDWPSRLHQITTFVHTLDLTAPVECEAKLRARFPADAEPVRSIIADAQAGLDAGTLCDRGEAPVTFSRLVKPEQSELGYSVDAVLIDEAAGPAHVHPKGEITLCIPRAGEPTFDGVSRDVWCVMRPGSGHVPTVAGGAMLFIYWWPEGAVEWK
jgi:hypothetical protein